MKLLINVKFVDLCGANTRNTDDCYQVCGVCPSRLTSFFPVLNTDARKSIKKTKENKNMNENT